MKSRSAEAPAARQSRYWTRRRVPFFVWCNDGDLRMGSRDKVHELGRRDLIVIGPHGLESREINRLRGNRYPAIIFDHTVRDLALTPEQWAGYQQVLATLRRPGNLIPNGWMMRAMRKILDEH